SFRYVTYVTVSDNGSTIFYTKDAVNDTLKKAGVFAFDTRKQNEILIDTSSKHRLYKGLAIDKTGSQLAWMATADSAEADVRAYALYYKRLTPPPTISSRRKKNAALSFSERTAMNTVVLADTLTKAYPKGWNVNEYRTPSFSEDGRRLYFATSILPPKPIKDSTVLDEERVKVDVWSWNDPTIQPMQLKQLKQEKERGFLAVCDLTTGGITQLGNRDMPNVQIDPKADQPYWLGLSNLPYQISSMWDPGQTDLYLIDAKTGQKKQIASEARVSYAQLSPGGKYAWWYDERDSLWRAWSIAEGKRIDLTRGIPARFFDEEHDTPDLPGSYGAAGWSRDDRYVLIYDRFDLWRIDPTGQEKPVNLTAGYGRKNRIRLRRANLNPDEKVVPLTGDLWLTGFWESNKATGILRKPMEKPAVEPVVLARGDYR
ncbi:MAG: S9 family peptidase, partial [Sphingobacteriales bacterium]